MQFLQEVVKRRLAPKPFACVPKTRAKKRNVQEALTNNRWLEDIPSHYPVAILSEFLDIWDLVQELVLQPDIEDAHKWRFEASGKFSTKSVYEAFFYGSTYFAPSSLIWDTWAPRKCKFFLWLVAHNRCWTADRLARRGLPHPDHCPLCDQEDETINQLLSACVFARQFWHQLWSFFGIPDVTPQMDSNNFFLWWQQANEQMSKGVRDGFNTLVALGAWTLWKARNDTVFNGTTPRVDRTFLITREESEFWMLAGAKGLGALVASRPPVVL
jgi:hypothetical protein